MSILRQRQRQSIVTFSQSRLYEVEVGVRQSQVQVDFIVKSTLSSPALGEITPISASKLFAATTLSFDQSYRWPHYCGPSKETWATFRWLITARWGW